jgi:hypothetical protein
MFPKSCNIHNIIDTFNKEFMKLITSNIVACVHRPIVARVQLSHASNCRARPIVARPGCATSFRASSFRRPIDVTPFEIKKRDIQ